jgi:mannose-6-phosphate isomerase-like protein (cupin superfamily)
MAGVEARSFANPDEVRSPDKTTVELVKLAGGEIGRYTFQPGWSWSSCIKPVVGGEHCQVEHVGYVVSGALRIDHADGTTVDLTPGDVYRIGPGHDGTVVGSEPAVVVEFQGAAIYAKA